MRSPAAISSFRDLYGTNADAAANAPGRVNLIGDHTGYHQGYVLPAVIPQRASVEGRRRADGLVRVWSEGTTELIAEYSVGTELAGRGWLDYVQGVTALLARRGHEVGGLDLMIRSTVPVGAGVSASAALLVAVLRLLRRLWALDLDDVEIARLAQLVATEFAGVPVGIMDTMACSLGVEGEALYLDTRTLAHQPVPLPPSMEIVVISSGDARRQAGGGDAIRRRESFAAAERLGVVYLRDADLASVARLDADDPMLARRARHVITENQRVLDTVAALQAGEIAAAGALLNASHLSLRDDYEVSTLEIDRLVALAQQHRDILGARLIGGGVGSAVVMIARAGSGDAAAQDINRAYEQRSGLAARILVP